MTKKNAKDKKVKLETGYLSEGTISEKGKPYTPCDL